MDLDLRDPDFLANPAPHLARLRQNGPLAKIKVPIIGKLWVTTDDASARALLKSPDDFVRDMRSVGGKPIEKTYWWLPATIKPLLTTMIGADGETHKRLRRAVDTAFARIEVENMRAPIEGMADGLLNDLGTEAELIEAFARPLPLMAICELLGVKQQDRARVAAWIAPLSGPATMWMILRALPGLRRLMHYFRAEFAAQRITPRTGLIGNLISEGTLTDDEMLSAVVLLFLAGHETTVHLIGMTLRTLLARPDIRDSVRNDPRAMATFIEEILRYDSPVMLTKPMFAARDLTFQGMPLKRGERVMALLIGANHDPARFIDPESMIPPRKPNAHLGFGHGPHVCLGMQLARAEAQIAAQRFLHHYPNASRTEPDTFLNRIGIRGLTSIKVRLT